MNVHAKIFPHSDFCTGFFFWKEVEVDLSKLDIDVKGVSVKIIINNSHSLAYSCQQLNSQVVKIASRQSKKETLL